MHEHLRPADDKGNPNDRLLLVATLLHKLEPSARKDKKINVAPLQGFMGFVDAAGAFFVGDVHRAGRMQSWLTHFALVLKYENDDSCWLMQRDKHGVDYYPCIELSDFSWEWEARVTYSSSRPECIVCNIARTETDWPTLRKWGDVVRRWNVWDRLQDEGGKQYDFVGKNCQHFAYDFYKHTLEHSLYSKLAFHQYTEECQQRFVKQGGLGA